MAQQGTAQQQQKQRGERQHETASNEANCTAQQQTKHQGTRTPEQHSIAQKNIADHKKQPTPDPVPHNKTQDTTQQQGRPAGDGSTAPAHHANSTTASSTSQHRTARCTATRQSTTPKITAQRTTTGQQETAQKSTTRCGATTRKRQASQEPHNNTKTAQRSATQHNN